MVVFTIATSCAQRGASDPGGSVVQLREPAAYERYRARFGSDPEFVATDKIRDDSGCIVRYERTFVRPLLPAIDPLPSAACPSVTECGGCPWAEASGCAEYNAPDLGGRGAVRGSPGVTASHTPSGRRTSAGR